VPHILAGTAVAAEIRTAAALRAATVRARIGRAPTLAAVAVETHDSRPLFFDVKRQAFEAAGAAFQPHVLPADTTTAALIDTVRSLNADEGVDGIYVQYPMPPHIAAQTACDVIALAKDVDGASAAGETTTDGRSATAGRAPASVAGRFAPATAEAVVRLLAYHDVAVRGRGVCIVRGDALFAEVLARLFADAGARPVVVDLEDRASGAAAADCMRTAPIVVAATGVVNGVSAAGFADGVVAVDVGYYHGGGRGDIAASPADIARMSAYAPPRGAIGPLTVAILVDHTVAAACASS
jgi:methylenetetrahydrofolate dehydrogenase (NADP+)/methenyltetrahydrofolate cyclohydrolase